MEYFEKMKTIQNYILMYLEDNDERQNFDDLIQYLQQSRLDIHELKSTLYLISKTSENHYRNPHFFEKTQKLINLFKKEIKQAFSNIEIFNIFKENKQILLYLFDEDLITFDSNILT